MSFFSEPEQNEQNCASDLQNDDVILWASPAIILF